jgi:hypothetical protein
VQGEEATHPLNPTENENCREPAQQPVEASLFPPLGIENIDENRKMQNFAFNWKQFSVSPDIGPKNPENPKPPKSVRPSNGSKSPKPS